MYNRRPSGSNIWEDTNAKMISLASSGRYTNTTLLVLWDMLEENNPGGTYSMIQLAKENGIAIQWIDTRAI